MVRALLTVTNSVENFLKELENIMTPDKNNTTLYDLYSSPQVSSPLPISPPTSIFTSSSSSSSMLLIPQSRASLIGGFVFDEHKSATGFKVNPYASQFSQFGSLLMFFADSFKLYTSYITNYKEAAEHLQAEKKKNKKFKELLVDKYKSLTKEHQPITNLEGFLITPVQRIPRYRLLLEELLKNMETTDESYQQIKGATEYITNIASYCNEKSGVIDKSTYIIHVVEKLKIDRMTFVKPSRRFICEELDSMKLIHGKKIIPCDMYIFSDVLLVSTFPISIFGTKSKRPRVQKLGLKVGTKCPEKKDREIGSIDLSIEDVCLVVRCTYKPSTKGVHEIRVVCDTAEQSSRLLETIESLKR